MVPCLVIGDSIAVGVARHRPECRCVAQVGISSSGYVQTLLTPLGGTTIVISLGANDDVVSGHTFANLLKVRRAVQGGTVYWLLPGIKETVRSAIRSVAAAFGDHVIDTKAEAGPDHLHPTGAGYALLAAETRPP
jgi:hypothetical protein